MKILIVGQGASEHALAHRLAQSATLQVIYLAPGNLGTQQGNFGLGRWCQNVPCDSPQALTQWALNVPIDCVIVSAGMTCEGIDYSAAQCAQWFREQGLPTLGPSLSIATIVNDSSQLAAFAQRHQIPFHADSHLPAEAPCLYFNLLTDGTQVLALSSVQSYLARDDHDQGMPTQGMGAYSPISGLTPPLHARIWREVVKPLQKALSLENLAYCGFLRLQLSIDTAGNPALQKLHCTLGDPQQQVIWPRLKSDLADVLRHLLDGRLSTYELEWDRRYALGVVMVHESDPQPLKAAVPLTTTVSFTPTPIDGQEQMIYLDAVASNEALFEVTGSRALTVVALADTLKMAQKIAYEQIQAIQFTGQHYRTDIGARSTNNLANPVPSVIPQSIS